MRFLTAVRVRTRIWLLVEREKARKDTRRLLSKGNCNTQSAQPGTFRKDHDSWSSAIHLHCVAEFIFFSLLLRFPITVFPTNNVTQRSCMVRYLAERGFTAGILLLCVCAQRSTSAGCTSVSLEHTIFTHFV